jgi:hypothetical protein
VSTRVFDPLRVVEVLNEHQVRYLLIGGFAARLLGSPTVTGDLDICYGRDDENLGRLAQALVELGARLRGAAGNAPFPLDAKTLHAGDHFTFVTDAGNLDCLGTPAGTSGFEELQRAATEMDLDGLTVLVASIDDLIRMKRAAGRPKDLIETEILGALREEIDHRAKEQGRRRRKP